MVVNQGPQPADRKKLHLNLAKLKKGGENFEVVVDPDLAVAHKQGKDVSLREVLKSAKIMNDAQKGIFASETKLKELFGTDNALKIAEKIIQEGEIQLTTEYRAQLRENKIKKIIGLIHMNGVDPRTGAPHPPQRIENAINTAKVRIDDYKSAEDQVEEIVDALRPILPIRFETDRIDIQVPAQFSSKSFAIIKRFAKVITENWNNDGSLSIVVEIPAGLREEMLDQLNALAHGDIETKTIEKH